MKNKTSISLLLSVVVVLASSCEKPDAQPVPEDPDINSSNLEVI